MKNDFLISDMAARITNRNLFENLKELKIEIGVTEPAKIVEPDEVYEDEVFEDEVDLAEMEEVD